MKKIKKILSIIKSSVVKVWGYVVRAWRFTLKTTNVIRREIVANFRSWLIWTVSLIAVLVVASLEFAAFVGNDSLLESMASFAAFFKALGVEITDLSTPEGFVSLESVYLYIPLAIYGALLGGTLISKEERDKTAEYLFTLPVSRTKVIISKIVVGVFYNILVNLFVVIATYLTYLRFSPTQAFTEFLINLSIGLIGTQMVFMAIGMLLASTMKQYKKSGAATLGIVIGTYFLFVLIGFTDKIDFLRFFTPFKYFAAGDMLNGIFHLEYIIISISIFIVGLSGLFIFYRRRDLNI
ncbi:MAG: ABC transporter permease [Acholeplasmataceae bacterium]|nr:ABC transporter permease [Acholeplasmataceae bacterium]